MLNHLLRAASRTDRQFPEDRRTGDQRSRRGSNDVGTSLVEVLVSIVLLGMVGSAVLAATATAARGARVHREQADLQLVAVSAANAIQGRTPEPCATALNTYQQAARARVLTLGREAGWSTNVTVTGIQTWNQATREFDATCARAGAVQKVQIEVRPLNDGPVARMEVLTTSGLATTPIGRPSMSSSEWSIISEGDVTISGTQVYGALAVGGDLRFTTSGPIAANSQGDFGPILGTTTKVGLLVNGRVVLNAGTLYVNQSASVVIGDMTGVKYVPNGGVGCVVPSSATSCTQPRLTLQGTGNAVAGRPYDFVGAFDGYRKSAAAMATLVPDCPNATPVVLRNQNNNGPWSGSGNFHLQLTTGKVNVWNMTVAQLQSWSSSNNNGAMRPSATTPLVINVTSSGSVSFSAPGWLQNDAARYIVWNFPNASTVTFTGTLWGSLFAPNSSVTLKSDVRGVVVAKSVIASGGVTDWNKRPDVVIDCPRAA